MYTLVFKYMILFTCIGICELIVCEVSMSTKFKIKKSNGNNFVFMEVENQGISKEWWLLEEIGARSETIIDNKM